MLWIVKEARTGLGQHKMLMGTSKIAENHHGSKQGRIWCLPCQISHFRACKVCRTDLAASSRNSEFRGQLVPAFSVSPRRSRGWPNPARIQRRLSLPRPSLGLRGPRADLRIPRIIPRRLSSRPLLLCLRGARAGLRRPRANREGSAGHLSSLSPRTVVAEFRKPRELRGDSDWGWVWFGLRVRFGLVLTAKFYCSANSNVL